jgi:hypothetical protein
MRNWFERLTAGLVRRGVRQGLLGGSGVWLAIGAVSWLARFLARRPERRVVVEQLAIGETIVVTSVPPPPSGRRRRKLEKTARRASREEAKEVRRQRKQAQTVPAVDRPDASATKSDSKKAGRAPG